MSFAKHAVLAIGLALMIHKIPKPWIGMVLNGDFGMPKLLLVGFEFFDSLVETLIAAIVELNFVHVIVKECYAHVHLFNKST